ncbi:Protein N-acetyltransferase, RimJ/RimL family [Faunimonas pinastri]|uniref:Protein N-acetyltransferase, RimJ/RimL family n=1 Tax=Faunimonas pinastri TaxID=1855383 RepID=A0A1H9NR68_9HYPH|nr:GNAT family protein [Faunimonas pinastri]SER38418.1 Protein N-acetyltransferase, RimJ/RimL family [Faunimonas pinastri]
MSQPDLVHWSSRPLPDLSPMQGRTVRLEALDGERHGADLWQAFGQTANATFWDYLPEGPFADEESFRAALLTVERRPDWITFAILDAASGRALGSASYMRMDPANGVGEVGFVTFGEGLSRRSGATEAMYLMARRLFDELGYRRYEWKCNALNEPSKRAAARLGFTYEGTFRQHMVVKGRNRDTGWFSILDSEWPIVRAGLERWLDAANFDGEGRQVQSLTECRENV